ncbi:MAG: DUF2726 domain-containing protein, partial [Pseudomonadota bacterium]
EGFISYITSPAALVLLVPLILALIFAYIRRRPATEKQSEDAVSPALTSEDIRLELQPAMNVSERNIFAQLQGMVGDQLGRPDLTIHAQVAMSGVIAVKAETWGKASAAMNTIARKRFDFVVIDREGNARVAIEYNGPGHKQGNAKKRDQVKRIACERAGIPLVVIEHPQEVADVKADIAAHI